MIDSLSSDLRLQKWQIEYKKGFSRPLILFALAKSERSYAFLLSRRVMELTRGQILIAGSNIYPLLARLEEEELVMSSVDENERKYYELTAKGREFLENISDSIKIFSQILVDLFLQR